MKTLGLDIGTTTISAVVCHSTQGVIDARTVPNRSFRTGASWERIQDPNVIWDTAIKSVHALMEAHPDLDAIGVTGQMHGILYLDQNGEPVSPLYTWQDGRGDLPYDQDHSWAAYLSQQTGYPLATGYGMVTHSYNLRHGLVPPRAAVFCTIHDYIAMRLAGRTSPLIDPTDAASFGLYDGPRGCFDQAALERAAIDPALLPKLIEDPCLGTGPLGLPVYAAIGDNQASFLGSTEGRTDVLLVNVGTGSQISLYSPDYLRADTLETRPFPDGGWLLVGASLCGGRSYALLADFFRETAKMVTGIDTDAYEPMSRLLDDPAPQEEHTSPQVTTTFQGTRKDPSRTGAIQGLDIHNFSPRCLIQGFMQGMADELYEMYRGYLDKGGKPPVSMIGSGNGLRKNKHLCKVFEATFGCPLVLSHNQEEAACGAAIYAAKHQA